MGYSSAEAVYCAEHEEPVTGKPEVFDNLGKFVVVPPFKVIPVTVIPPVLSLADGEPALPKVL